MAPTKRKSSNKFPDSKDVQLRTDEGKPRRGSWRLWAGHRLSTIAALTVVSACLIASHVLSEEGQRHVQELKPTLILHVGPPKTGTTFLQCSLCTQTNKTDPFLLKDNYVYIGTCPWSMCYAKRNRDDILPHTIEHVFPGVVASFLNEPSFNPFGPAEHAAWSAQMDPPKIRKRFKYLLERTKGRNALFVFEDLSLLPPEYIAALAAYLYPDWNVKIVVAYRHLFSWLLSRFNQANKVWPPELPENKCWPGEACDVDFDPNFEPRGKVVQPFDLNDRGSFTAFVRQMETTGQHTTETIMHNFAQHFGNVSFIDLEHLDSSPGSTGDGYLQHLFCHVAQAKHTCQAAQDGLLEGGGQRNPYVPLTFDILGVAAYQRGLVPRTARRLNVLAAVREYMRRNNVTDFPLECLPQSTLDRLLSLSLRVERNLFGGNWTNEMKEDHRQKFADAVEQKKFCHMDVEQTLQQEEWRSFFSAIAASESLS